MVRLQTLDLRIGVRIPASQPTSLASLVRCLVGLASGADRLAALVARRRRILPPSQAIQHNVNESESLRDE